MVSQRQTALMRLWQARVMRGRLSHLKMAEFWWLIDSALTGFNVVSSLIVLGIGISDQPISSYPWHLLISFLTISIAITSIGQYVINPREKITQHRRATHGFLVLSRDLEEAIVLRECRVSRTFLDEIRTRRDRVAEEAPQIPKWSWHNLPINSTIRALEASLDQVTY